MPVTLDSTYSIILYGNKFSKIRGLNRYCEKYQFSRLGLINLPSIDDLDFGRAGSSLTCFSDDTFGTKISLDF